MNGFKGQANTPIRNMASIQNVSGIKKENAPNIKRENQLGSKQNNQVNKQNSSSNNQNNQQQSAIKPQMQSGQQKIANGNTNNNVKSNGQPGQNRGSNPGQQMNQSGNSQQNKKKINKQNNNMNNVNQQGANQNSQNNKSPKPANNPNVNRSNDNFVNKFEETHPSAMGAGVNPRSHFGGQQFKVVLGQSTVDLPEMNHDEKKFTGRCRIFVANLPNNVTEEQVRLLFEEHGQVSEVYLGKSNFGFVKMDTRSNAEKARNAIDGRIYEGRMLRVRLAAHAAAIRVKNLSPYVTNELLEYAFSYFGEVERAIVIADDRGRSIGEGIVEFSRKFSATNALKRCSSECFLITGSPKPVYVEPFEQRDEDEGFPEKQLNKHLPEFRQEREVGPRFAEQGSFEYEYAMLWKQLYDIEKQKRESLEQEIQDARKGLQEQQEFSRVEHQTKILREQLREMEEKSNQFNQLRTTRADEDRRREEERKNQLMFIRQQEEQIIRRPQMQDYTSLRREENDLRSKANALQDLLEKQEQALRQLPNQPIGQPTDQTTIYPNQMGYGDGLAQQQPFGQNPYNPYNQMPAMVGPATLNSGMENRYPTAAGPLGPLGPQSNIAPYSGGAPGSIPAGGFAAMSGRSYGGSPGGPSGPNGPRFNQHKQAEAGNQSFLPSGQAKRARRF